MNTKILFGLALGTCVMVAGCAETVVQQRGRVVQLGGAQYSAAFAAGLGAMRDEFVIEKQDELTGEIIGRPAVYTGDEPSERISTELSGRKAEMRRKAWLRLSSGSDGLTAEVRVDIERRDTEDYQINEDIRAAEDLRIRTPAERRDTARLDQREVWTFIRRDMEAEEVLIRGLTERLEQR